MTGETHHDTDELEALIAELDAEAECLEELVRVLEAEGEALRHMRRAELEAIAEAKLRITEQQQLLVSLRAARVAAVLPEETPSTLTEIQKRLGERSEPIRPRQRKLRALCDRAAVLSARNDDRARHGASRVDEALRVMRGRRNPVYGADGRTRAFHGQAATERGRF